MIKHDVEQKGCSTALTVAEADDHIARGDIAGAERILLDLHRHKPDFADICNRLGQLYFSKGDYPNAKEYLLKAVRLNPDYTEASLNLAVTYNELKQYGKAKDVIERAQVRAGRKQTQLDPFVAGKLANKHKEIGDIYHELGLLDKAAGEYRKALALSPGFPDIQVRLGIIFREMGRIEESIDILSRAAGFRPDFLDARIQLGITYFSQGFVDRAAAEWNDVLNVDPDNSKAQMYLSFIDE